MVRGGSLQSGTTWADRPGVGASTAFLIAASAVLAVLMAGAVSFNRFVRERNHVREAWSNVDTELRRRHDLIPNLVEAVKGYAAHERATLEAVIRARSVASLQTGDAGEHVDSERGLVRSIRDLLAVAEQYPTLKADRHFSDLQSQLVETEDRIQLARRVYNANVRDLNRRIESFPSNVVAGLAGFVPAEFFEVEESLRQRAPSADFAA